MSIHHGGRGPGHKSRKTSPGAFVGGAEPVTSIEPPAITNTPPLRVGDSLTWTNGTWFGSPDTFTAEIYADGVVIPGGPYVSGEYPLAAAEDGSNITVGVVATSGVGPSAEVFSAAVGPVVTGHTAPVAVWVSDGSVLDPEFSLTEIIEDDIVSVEIDDNADFSSLFDSDTNSIDAAEALSGELTFPGISTLTADETYYARFRYFRGGYWSPWSATVSKTMSVGGGTAGQPVGLLLLLAKAA